MPADLVSMVVLLFLVVLGLTGLVAVLFFVVFRVARAKFGPRRRLEAELGVEVLQGRLARGEITQAEFDQARRALGA
jgi:uncharacterized membrane protein